MKPLGTIIVLAAAAVGLALGSASVSAQSPPSPVAGSAMIALSRTSGAPNTVVTVTGNGFPANEVVGLYLDAPGTYIGFPGPRADANGHFVESDALPGGKPGNHLYCADTSAPSPQPVAVKVCVPFKLLALPSSPSPAPSSASPSGLLVGIVLLLVGVLIGIAIGAAVWSRR